MKSLLLFCCLLATAPAFAQMQPPPPTSAELAAKQKAAEQTQAIEKAGVGTVAALDARRGFRGFQLNAPVSQYPSLKPRSKGVYAAPEEVMTVGTARLNLLMFFEDKGRLSTIALGASGTENCQALLDALSTQYGTPEKLDHQTWVWKGNFVTLYYTAKSHFVASGSPYISGREVNTCEVMFTSSAIAAERVLEKENAAKKAASDL